MCVDPWSRGYIFFMLNSAEFEIEKSRDSAFFQAQISLEAIFPAHKCKNANICWYFNIYEQEKILPQLSWGWNVLSGFVSLFNSG